MRHDPFPTRAEFKAIQGELAQLRAIVADLQRRATPAPTIHLTPEETQLPCAVIDERAGRAVLHSLLSIAATDTKMDPADIKNRTDRYAAGVRQWVYLEAHAKGCSYPMIGRFFDRDHSTIIHGCRVEVRRREGVPGGVGEFRSRRAD